jgi:hypothetical protein
MDCIASREASILQNNLFCTLDCFVIYCQNLIDDAQQRIGAFSGTDGVTPNPCWPLQLAPNLIRTYGWLGSIGTGKTIRNTALTAT